MKRLRMATKLALAIIPIGLVALAAGLLVARNALDRANDEERASLAGAVAADAMDSLVAFSAEHAQALDIAVGDSETGLESRQTATDNALARLSDSVSELTPRASGPASGIVANIAGDSSRVRSLIERTRESDPASPETAETVQDIGQRLISVVNQSTFYLGDENRAREGEGAVALARASFGSFQEELLITQNEFGQVPDGGTFAQQMLVLESTVEDWINTAAASSPTVQAQGFIRTQTLSGDEEFTSETFPTARDTILGDAASEILVRVSDSAEAAAAEARTQAGTVGVIVIAALVLAAITALVVGRSTTKRVRSITAAAHHVAEEDLPQMVDSLSNPSGVLKATTPMDVDKTGRDEVGELARSFSTLHTTLVDVANQQMETLRKGVSDIFVTLARRNRSLVDRQLALVDQLEAREEDPEILDGYYKLDHLATRMRRNAESLLVLAGAESPRMWAEPIEMGEVVRAALGEVDEYQRIEVLAMEPSMLAGRAVSDVSHLISELLDNATQFSPPTKKVRVTGLFDDAGYVVTIADSGVGMSPERMAELNRLMENPPVLGLALEPTLGIYVVARLGLRHGIEVKLVPGVPGTTVRMTIPRDLLETDTADAPTEPDEAAPGVLEEPAPANLITFPTPDPESGEGETSGLPARSPSGNGHSPAPTADDEDEATKPAATNGADTGPKEAQPFQPLQEKLPTNGSTATPSQNGSEPEPETSSANGGAAPEAKTKPPEGPKKEDQPAQETDAPSRSQVAESEIGKQPETPEWSPDEARAQSSKTSPPPTASERNPRHLAPGPSRPAEKDPPKPAEAKPQKSPDPEREPADNGDLPTRQPGTSFRETNEFATSSASSQSSAAGIRNALDGYRQGRDIATRSGEEPEGDDSSNDEEDQK